MPDFYIFLQSPSSPFLKFITFYDIFDGYYHVPLKFYITILKPNTLTMSKGNQSNTAPVFGMGPVHHIPFIPDQSMTVGDRKVVLKMTVYDE